jgi:hypothetical protein
MNRRLFLKNASVLSAGMAVIPVRAGFQSNSAYASKTVKRVVLCVAGGGVRHSEAAGMRFGNLMPGLFEGPLSSAVPGRLKDACAGVIPLSHGATFFPEFTYRGTAAGHRMALMNLLDGRVLDEETVRTKDFSDTALFRETRGKAILVTPDRPFYASYGFRGAFRKHIRGSASCENQTGFSDFSPELRENYEDIRLAETAAHELLLENPEFLCVTFFGADEAHGSFSKYLENLTAMSLSVHFLWKTIQNNDVLRDETAMVVIPDFGRNGYSNSLLDEFGSPGCDHGMDDPLTAQIFCFVAGPGHIVRQNFVSGYSGSNTDVAGMIRDLRGI